MPPFLFISIGAGLLSAVLYGSAASGSALSIIPIYLSPLPLFMAGLAYGGVCVHIAGAVGTLAITLAGGPQLAIAYFVVNAAAPMLLCHAAAWSREVLADDGQTKIEYYPTGLLFAWLCGLGIAIMTMLAAYMQTVEGGLGAWIPRILQVDILTQTIIQAQIQTGGVPSDEADLRQNLIQMALPGLALFWTLLCIANGVLAQRLLVRLGRNMRPSPDFLGMYLPQFLIWPLSGGLIMALFPGDIGLLGAVIATLALIPYFFLGLATVHVISHRLAGRGFVLAGLYMLLLIFGWPALLVVGIGLVEQFANLRLNYAVARP